MANIARREPVGGLSRSLDRFFHDPFLRAPLLSWGWADLEDNRKAILPVDVIEGDDELIVTTSLPGYDREEINVEVEDSVLTIGAEHIEESEVGGDEDRYLRRERRYGAVHRSFAIPADIEDGEIEAELHNGVLTLHIPRGEEPVPGPNIIDVKVRED
jgi:HSP20 family protein